MKCVFWWGGLCGEANDLQGKNKKHTLKRSLEFRTDDKAVENYMLLWKLLL